MKKLFSILILIAMVFMMTSCEKNIGEVELPYYNEEGEADYNPELFYRNDLKQSGADPTIIYVTEGEYAGYFFVYPTYGGCTNYSCYKSKDCHSWEFVSIAFEPDDMSWSKASLWAPSVIYDPTCEFGNYILFYCARNDLEKNGPTGVKYIGMAYSDSPAGPFIQYTGTNSKGQVIDIDNPLINMEKYFDHSNPEYKEKGMPFIDPCAFIDPVTNEKYLYVCRSRSGGEKANEIYVFHMFDWATPDYESYTKVARINKTKVLDGEQTELFEGEIDEAPDMLYHDGLYYLTMSINATTDKNYSVIQAISTSPMGPFEKIQASKGGLVLGSEVDWDHLATCGSHDFVEVNGEIYCIYHQSMGRAGGNMDRAFAMDKIEFVKNEDGLTLLKAVGPTYSIQPKPEVFTGYKNIAPLATITATNAVNSTDLLHDKLVRFHDVEVFDEFIAKDTTTITLKFDKYYKAKALLVYNSYDYFLSFYHIKSIKFSFMKEEAGETVKGKAVIKDVYYDFDKYADIQNEMMRPGAPMVFEFEELLINSVEIVIEMPADQEKMAISEIMLLGKEE